MENQKDLLQRLKALSKYAWYCPNPGCDGEPHDVYLNRHARPAQRPPDTDWWGWFLRSGRGFGKALALNTPLPTPTGWVEMGCISVGDEVYDEKGAPCRVVGTFDTFADAAWRVSFSDGSHIDACEDHQWITQTALDRKRQNRRGSGIPTDWANKRTITTAQLVNTIHHGNRGGRNHSIPVTQPLSADERVLPIDPWVLGVWLGDGDSAGAVITCHDDDAPFITAEMRTRGEPITRTPSSERDDSRTGRYAVGCKTPVRDRLGRMSPNGSLHTRLRELDLIGNKHVPTLYLRASSTQRLDLLRGLVDTDGYVSPFTGHVEFCSVTRELAEAVLELARSLGQIPTLTEGVAALYGRIIGPRYRVTWRPTLTCASLPRKVQAHRPVGAQAGRTSQRMVVGTTPITPQPMRCITVDSPNAMYLAGAAMVPTHNTRSGSEFVKDRMLTIPGHRVAIIVPDFGVGRDVCIEGRSGLHGPTAGDGVLPAGRIKTWNRSLGELVLDNGSIAKIFGTDKRKDAEKLRGFEFSTAWFEELGSCVYGEVAWDMLEFGLRADDPKVVITSTPRPTPLIKRLCADPDILVVTGSTYDNIDNLSPKFAARIKRRYEGTTLGRQELYGEILDGSDGALWNYDIIGRVTEAPHLVAVVIAVDPAGTAHATSDLTGILVIGKGEDGKLYVLADKSDRYSPEQWRRVVVDAYVDYSADAVVAETNFGADMVAANLRTSDIGTRPVFVPVTASRGKAIRATPVVGLYEQGRGQHVGTFPELEVELTTWVPPGQFDADGEPIPESKWSPNRLDALVWGCTHLALKPRRPRSRMRFPISSR